MIYREPKEINNEWTLTQVGLLELEKTYRQERERLLHKRQLLEAELLLSKEYYNKEG